MITVAVENLKPGMAVDLENDEYADPFGHSGEEHDPVDGGGRCSHMYFVDQLALVHEVTEEEGGAIIGVDFDCDSVGFPRGHKVQVDETAGRAADRVSCSCGEAWADEPGHDDDNREEN